MAWQKPRTVRGVHGAPGGTYGIDFDHWLRELQDMDIGLIKPPMPAFLIRFPEKNPPLCWGDGWHVHSMLIGPTSLHKGVQIFDGFVLWVDTGERDTAPDGTPYPVHTYINLPMKRGMTLEESLRALPYDLSAYQGMVSALTRWPIPFAPQTMN